MKYIFLLMALGCLAGCGDPNYKEPPVKTVIDPVVFPRISTSQRQGA